MRTTIVALLCFVASPALAQDDYNSVLGMHLRLGFAGGATASGGGLESDGDLGTTVGIGLRGEVPVFRFLAIGGLFEAAAFQPDIPFVDDETRWALDFDLWVRARYLFDLGEVAVEPYVGLPFGLTIGFLPDPDDGTEEASWPGWNIGVMGGVYVLSKIGIGGLFELGWRHHAAYNSTDPPIGDSIDQSIVTDELAMNIGVLFALW